MTVRRAGAKFQTDLSHGGAFHLDALDVGQQTQDFLPFFIAVDELVAAGDVAEMQGRGEVEFLDGLLPHHVFHASFQQSCHGLACQLGQLRVAVDIYSVEQGQLEARDDGTGVQVVLHQTFGNHDVAHLEAFGQGPCRADEDQIRHGELLY